MEIMYKNPMLISNPTNIRYMTEFAGLSPSEREAYVLLTDTSTYLFTNPLYREVAKSLQADLRCKIKDLRLIEISKEYPFSKALASVCEKEGIQKLDFEENDLRVMEYESLKHTLKRTTLIHSLNRIEDLRTCKRQDEIDSIKRASGLTDDCYTAVLKVLVPGVFESDIAMIIESFFKRQGADSAFSPIVAFGKNTSKPHYAPDGKGAQLKERDIVLLDFGARVNGYCSDMTRMVFVGKPYSQWTTAYATLLETQRQVIDYMTSCSDVLKHQNNISGGTADEIARTYLKKAGYEPYPHSLGHGLGLDIHESPRLYKDIEAVLLPGMVITIEPGIYIEEKFGMRIEDTILISESGIEILTHTTKELFVI